MLKDRGYLISEKKLNETREEFAANYNESRDSLNMIVEKRPLRDGDIEIPQAQKMLVFFPD